MLEFNKDKIMSVQKQLRNIGSMPKTEEATKQWFVLPLLVALGYDPFSTDIIPEFTLDVGIKRGERIDYALQVNNQPVAIIECKALDVTLSEKHTSQLFRYFSTCNVHIAVLTNGDDYWFYTDSLKSNIMDLEPYFKIKLSTAPETELKKLQNYSKGAIQHIDISKMVQYERFISECRNFISGLRTNSIGSWIIDELAQRSNVTEVDRSILAGFLYREVIAQFGSQGTMSKQEETPAKPVKEKKVRSSIKLNNEYVYNDYSDGDWTGHKLQYAIIFDEKYELPAKMIVPKLLSILSARGLVNLADLVEAIPRLRLIQELPKDSTSGFYSPIEGTTYYVYNLYAISAEVCILSDCLAAAKLPDTTIKFSFRS